MSNQWLPVLSKLITAAATFQQDDNYKWDSLILDATK